ncbi:hypothetical protein [Desulfopila aestuarii]|uniref:Uncharacterized protein n=1 Tax=Desulfopila aestuarii DSM 18488 TaxID=1121416 RepID=A0A1M7Y3Z3_9BACT|nr:hypothetical protein [Desulfopila aestuarii]SHO46976.1 hypothetical protein SAMN02745220_01717 [Desulfopila aestuarii DSM 18488]
MLSVNAQLKIQSFAHGLMMPVPGMKALEKQIRLELGETSGRSAACCFAIGHMVIAYPVIVSVGVLFYKLMEI